ncbi:MAG: DNA methylase [Desulfurococcales archaeon ex4484_58]|nr:MAG: DNA methylase [Desulfurococcales archaeon ex4484_58]
MKKITYREYLEYIEKYDEITIEDKTIKLEPIRIRRFYPEEKELTDISTTVWSFPKRGSWATHRGDYRGNWPPQMARALILKYTKPGDTVLDPMIGSGTTCIEAKLLGRNCIGVDINYNAVILTLHRLYWLEKNIEKHSREELEKLLITNGVDASLNDILDAKIEIYHGDACRLDKIDSDIIDLVATHPPYLNIIKYGRRREKIVNDLSLTRSLKEYLELMKKISSEIYRVLKPGHHLGILVGDTRIHKHYVPITHYVLQVLLDTGFILREEIVKIQHKMKTTREIWSKLKQRDFLLIYHEKLFILRKPVDDREYKKYKYSVKQDFIKLEF